MLAGNSFFSLAGRCSRFLFESFWLLLTLKYTKDNALLQVVGQKTHQRPRGCGEHRKRRGNTTDSSGSPCSSYLL